MNLTNDTLNVTTERRNPTAVALERRESVNHYLAVVSIVLFVAMLAIGGAVGKAITNEIIIGLAGMGIASMVLMLVASVRSLRVKAEWEQTFGPLPEADASDDVDFSGPRFYNFHGNMSVFESVAIDMNHHL